MTGTEFPQWVLNLMASLRGASYLRLTSQTGTELTLVVEGRPFEFGRSSGGGGQIWIAPVEYLGEGLLKATHHGAAVEFLVQNGVLVEGSSPDPEASRSVQRLLGDAPEGRRIRLLGWCMETGQEPLPGTGLKAAFLSFGLYPQPGPECGASDSNFDVRVEWPEIVLYTTDGSGYRIMDGYVQLI